MVLFDYMMRVYIYAWIANLCYGTGNEPDHSVKPMSTVRLRSNEDAEDDDNSSSQTSGKQKGEDDDNSSSQTSGKQKGEDVYLNIIRQTMHRLRETKIYATKNCHRDIKVREK